METNTNAHNDTPAVHPTAGDHIPQGNERPFSTSLEDLYHSLRSVRAGLYHTGEDMLTALHRCQHGQADAWHAIFYGLLDSLDCVLKEMLWASNIARTRGTNWIANDAAIAATEAVRRKQEAARPAPAE